MEHFISKLVISVHHWAILSNNFNLVALLCPWCIFYFISNPGLDFRGAWCTLLFLIVALGQHIEPEVELNTETLVFPEGRIEF